MKMFLLALALSVPLSTALAPPVVAQATPPAELPEAQRASAATAQTFAQVYQPAELVTGTAVEMARKAFAEAAAADPNSARMEKELPGVTGAAAEAVGRTVERIYRRELPKSHAAIAELVQRYMTEQELGEVIAFYRSSAGQATLRAVAGTLDTNAIKQKYQRDGDAQLTKDDLQNAIQPSFLGKMSAEEVSGVARFSSSKTGRKFFRLAPRLGEIVAQQVNQTVASGQSEVQEAVLQTVRAYASKRTGDK